MRAARLVLAVVVLAVVAGAFLLDGDEPKADRRGAQVLELTLDSRAVGRELPVSVVVPTSAPERAPMLVLLHGRGGDERSFLIDELFDGLRALGSRAPIVVLPDGGGGSYWHDRRDGDWGSVVVDEVIPAAAARTGADRRRVAIGGVSMGGFGAFDLARRHRGRFCAVGGHAPALWRNAGETAPGAFDDAQDFERHDLVGAALIRPEQFAGMPLWLDAGEDDPLRPGFDAFASALDAAGLAVETHVFPGRHEAAYWNGNLGRYLRFYAGALAGCAPDRAQAGKPALR